MPSQSQARRPFRLRLARVTFAALSAGICVAPNIGCGREFFRHWADQDVSEAVFEKSRDPRARMDLFTIEPPSLSRFANPYDTDRPPAPPDDPMTEALAPAPQLPNHRLLVPTEGTGYVDILEKGPRYQAPPPLPKEEEAPPANEAVPPVLPIPPEGSPFAPGGNSGPMPGGMSPTREPNLPNDVPARPGADPDTSPPQAMKRKKDSGVLLSTFQAPAPPAPMPVTPAPLRVAPAPAQVAPTPAQVSPTPAPAVIPAPTTDPEPGLPPNEAGPRKPVLPPQDRIRSPEISNDPGAPETDVPNAPIPRDDLTPGDRENVNERSAKFARRLTPGVRDFNEALVSALPGDSRPFVVDPARALQLALMNSRAYQFNLENVYTAALAVTLQRFAFQPQFYAGLTPTTAPAGGAIPQNFQNSFTYRTKETIGGQNSTLSLGTVAGVGKALSFGGRLVAGFANQTVFNFLSSKPSQPTVNSYLPLTFVQPFLRGGGRAVTLEGLTQAERNLVYAVRSFARIRQEVVPTILTQNQAFDNQGTATDPTPGYLTVLVALQNVENDRRTVVAYEALYDLYQRYARNGAASGISQIQVDQIYSQLQGQRGSLLNDENTYKSQLDSFKLELGLPPDLPMVLDRSPTAAFRRVFNELDEWARRLDHTPEELDAIIAGLPKLDTIVVDDRELFRYSQQNKLTQVYARQEKQQEFLLAAERVALENRLDLMNNRGALYDAWRQLAVTANGLKGTFNVSLTNQITTSPGSTNPFAFLDQAKQFNVVFNTELPLVRVNERNLYRTATINYERARRLLQSLEDDVKLAARQEVYNLISFGENFEIAKTNLLVNIRQRDNTLKQIIAPPASIDTGGANSANQATQTNNLITGINNILNIQRTLVTTWVSYQTNRLALYRDLGLLPIDEWEAFYEFFPTSPSASVPPAAGGGGAAAGRPANPAS